ncbi:MAG: Fe-S-containing protein [Terriglobia bacterium]
MLNVFLISLREGVEAALVVGICLVYLRRTGRRQLERTVWWGVLAALLASVAGAWGVEALGLNEEGVEGFLLLLAAVLLIGMIVWMRRVARTLRGTIETRVEGFAAQSRFAALGLFLFVFSMVLREGIETVIFLSALSLNTQGLSFVLATGLGLALAVALSVFFFRGVLPLRLPLFFDATSLMLIVLTVQLTLAGLHELSEALLIPSGPWMMRLLGPIVRNDVFFFVFMLATAAWVMGRELLKHRPPSARERRWMTAASATALVVLVALTADYVYARGEVQLPPATPVKAASDVRLPVADVNDGALHRFRFLDHGSSINFLVIRHPDGRLLAALEACTICGAHGYYQEGEAVICKNCAAEIPTEVFDGVGGCNPIPVASWVEGDTLVVSSDGLRGGARYFQGRVNR